MVSVVLIFFTYAEHFTPLIEQIIKLEEALFNIQYEQHWLEAQTERQAIGKSRDTSSIRNVSVINMNFHLTKSFKLTYYSK